MNDDIVRPLSAYQVDYLRSLFLQEGDVTPAKLKVEFVALLNGDMVVGYIKYGTTMREIIGRFPKYRLPERFADMFSKGKDDEVSDTTEAK